MTSGRLRTSFWFTLRDSAPVVVSTSGASPTIETTSAKFPSSIVASTRALRPTSRMMPVRVKPLKPGHLDFDGVVADRQQLQTVLAVGRRSSRSSRTCVPVCVAVTVTPGTTAPWASFTLPRIVPVGICASTETATSQAATRHAHRFSKWFHFNASCVDSRSVESSACLFAVETICLLPDALSSETETALLAVVAGFRLDGVRP